MQMRSTAFLIYQYCSFQPAAKRLPVGPHIKHVINLVLTLLNQDVLCVRPSLL
jgi:hypothetical protein